MIEVETDMTSMRDMIDMIDMISMTKETSTMRMNLNQQRKITRTIVNKPIKCQIIIC